MSPFNLQFPDDISCLESFYMLVFHLHTYFGEVFVHNFYTFFKNLFLFLFFVCMHASGGGAEKKGGRES